MSASLHTRDGLRALVEGLERELAAREHSLFTPEALEVIASARRRVEAAGNLADGHGKRSLSPSSLARALAAIEEARQILAVLSRAAA